MFEPNRLETVVADHNRESGFAECKSSIKDVLDQVFVREFAGVPDNEKEGAERLFFAICKAVASVQLKQP